jgi:hypothetical protein
MAAFYLDEDVPEALASLLTAGGHRATTARIEGRKGVADDAQLWHAALNRWTFVTLNRRDYQMLHGAWRHWSVPRQHAGILVLPHVPRADLPALSAAIDALVSDPSAVLANGFYTWTAAIGWR